MNAISFLTETLQVLGIETIGVVALAVILFFYTKLMKMN